MTRYVGYVDPRRRVEHSATTTAASLIPELPEGRMMLCMVGGGQDGDRVAEAFARATLPDDAFGVIVTGPFMSEETVARLGAMHTGPARLIVLRIVDEAAHLLARADRVVAMAGYNSLCEVLAFGRPALLVPRDTLRQEQAIHAGVFAAAGVATVLPPSELSAEAITAWLATDPPATRSVTELIDFNGLDGIAALVEELSARPVRRARRAYRSARDHGGLHAVQ
jgi:predicted glycosyltransferase